MICPNCGKRNPSDSIFCDNCLSALTPTEEINQYQFQTHLPRKTNSIVSYVSLGVAIIALALVCFNVFILSNNNSGGNSTNPQIIDFGTVQITVKAGETYGKTHIFEADSDVVVVATSAGGDSAYSDVMYNNASGELFIFTNTVQNSDVTRSVNWVALENN